MTEEGFLVRLYRYFMGADKGDYRAVGNFIDNAAIWSNNGSSYQIRTKLQRKIKSMYSERGDKAEIKPWVEAFDKISCFIKYCYKGDRSSDVLNNISLEERSYNYESNLPPGSELPLEEPAEEPAEEHIPYTPEYELYIGSSPIRSIINDLPNDFVDPEVIRQLSSGYQNSEHSDNFYYWTTAQSAAPIIDTITAGDTGNYARSVDPLSIVSGYSSYYTANAYGTAVYTDYANTNAYGN